MEEVPSFLESHLIPKKTDHYIRTGDGGQPASSADDVHLVSYPKRSSKADGTKIMDTVHGSG